MANTISMIVYITLSQLLFYLWQTWDLMVTTALALIVIFALAGLIVLERVR